MTTEHFIMGPVCGGGESGGRWGKRPYGLEGRK